MIFKEACIESLAVALPDEIWTSAQIEERLRPLYERLNLPFGRLELMTGIKTRRMWPAGTRASDASAAAGRALLAKTALRPDQVELFIHAAVSRDMLEPATASFAHHKIGLPDTAQIFDVSNACLGFANALTIAAGLIDAGQIRCAMIVAGENGRPLVEHTVKTLLEQPFNRNEIKPYFANLTIGCGSAAAMVCHRSLVSGRTRRLVGAVALADTRHSELCQGDTSGVDALSMQTDSEELLLAGVSLAQKTWTRFQAETHWSEPQIARFVGHQVGSAHRRKLYETLGLNLAKDFSTFDSLGNMGSASLPATLARAVEAGAVREGDKVALFGIGSGLNCMMLALEW